MAAAKNLTCLVTVYGDETVLSCIVFNLVVTTFVVKYLLTLLQ